jgi:hypothetical protein
MPELVFAADGTNAERMIPMIRQAVRNYAYPNIGDYRAWPGPNSNTFVAAIIAAVPGCARHFPRALSARTFQLIVDGLGSHPQEPAFALIWVVIWVSPSAG